MGANIQSLPSWAGKLSWINMALYGEARNKKLASLASPVLSEIIIIIIIIIRPTPWNLEIRPFSRAISSPFIMGLANDHGFLN